MSIPGNIDYDAELLLAKYGWDWMDWLRGFKPTAMTKEQVEQWRREKGTTIVIDFTTLEDWGLAAQLPHKPLSHDNPEIKRKGLSELEKRIKKTDEDLSSPTP